MNVKSHHLLTDVNDVSLEIYIIMLAEQLNVIESKN